MNWQAVHGWVAESSLVRRAAGALSCAAGRRHLAHFDRQTPARCQLRILLGLLHQAQTTRFGLEHDFRRIRDAADFRRLVPLTSRAELWRDYWQPVYPNLAGATWPGERNKQTRRQGDKETKDGPSGLVTASPDQRVTLSGLHAAHRRALRTALALVVHSQPQARLLSGSILWADEDGPSRFAQRIPFLVRPYVRHDAELPPEHCARLPVSCLVGSVERLLPLLEDVKEAAGKRHLTDVWPGLCAVLYTRRAPVAPVDRLRVEAEGALLLEMAGRGEGPIAVEDPRHGTMRLLFDHGVYFEFVPPGQAGELRCPRYGIEEAELGVPYELAVTSPAGLWACRVGRTVCLERRDPPLLRFLDTAVAPKRRPRRTDLILPADLEPVLRPHDADTPVALPENSFHSPWSILADRG